MKRKVFLIDRIKESSSFCYVYAKNSEQALEIASGLDDKSFRSNLDENHREVFVDIIHNDSLRSGMVLNAKDGDIILSDNILK